VGRHDDFSPATGNGLMLWGVIHDGPTGLSSGTEGVMMIFHLPPVMASCCGGVIHDAPTRLSSGTGGIMNDDGENSLLRSYISQCLV